MSAPRVVGHELRGDAREELMQMSVDETTATNGAETRERRMRTYAREIIDAAVESRVTNATWSSLAWENRKKKNAARRKFRIVAAGNSLALAYFVLGEGNFEDDVRAALLAVPPNPHQKANDGEKRRREDLAND